MTAAGRPAGPVSRRARGTAVLAAASAVALAAAGCSGSADASDAAGRPLTVGLLLTMSGPYQSLGTDARDGFQLYLRAHGNRLGGHPITAQLADEGLTKDTAAAAAQKLLDAHATAIVGPLSGASFPGVVPLVTQARTPIVGVAARPDLADIRYVWNVSFLSSEPGEAAAPYVLRHVDGPVYAIGADYQGGWEQVRGFATAFVQAGGKLADKPAFTPFPGTTDFRPYLAKIKKSGAKAVYCFYAGQDAVDFVKQYAASDISNIPLYAAGFLTEGSLLKAEGPAAENITTVLDYSPDVDTAENRAFVAAWGAQHTGDQPSVFALTGYDAAALLDQALAKAGPDPTPDQVNSAIGTLGRIDSPRGAWQMAQTTHTPIQKWYLRRVQMDGTALANVKVEELSTLGG